MTVYITIRKPGIPEVTLQARDDQEQAVWDKAWRAFGDPTKILPDPTAIFRKHFELKSGSHPRPSPPTSAPTGRSRRKR